MKNELFERMAEKEAWAVFGFTESSEQPQRAMTEEVLIRSRIFLAEPVANWLDDEYGSRLVIFHPDSAVEFDMRFWLWRRAERGHPTRASRWVEPDTLYAVDLPIVQHWGYHLTGWPGWMYWLDRREQNTS